MSLKLSFCHNITENSLEQLVKKCKRFEFFVSFPTSLILKISFLWYRPGIEQAVVEVGTTSVQNLSQYDFHVALVLVIKISDGKR